MSNVSTKPITARQLLAMGDVGRCELIFGELVMMGPAGFDHGEIALRIGRLLGDFVEEPDLGIVVAAETGYLIETDPDLVRASDVSFVRKDRKPRGRTRGFFRGVPDLAIEVVSPNDTRRELAEKVNMWLAHGTLSCWVADPDTLTVTVHRTGQRARRLAMGDRLEEPAVSGFSVTISKNFQAAMTS